MNLSDKARPETVCFMQKMKHKISLNYVTLKIANIFYLLYKIIFKFTIHSYLLSKILFLRNYTLTIKIYKNVSFRVNI